MLRVATYNRLSSREQTKGDALVRHQFHLKEAVLEIDGDPSTARHLEDIESGASSTRSGLLELIALVENREVDSVVVLRTDRLTRDLGMVAKIVKLFESYPVKLYEIYRGGFIDFKNSSDWQYFANAGVKAEGERRELAARQLRTYKYQRFVGNPNYQIPYGYKRVRDGEKVWYEVDEKLEALAVRAIEIFIETGVIHETVRQVYLETGKKWSVTGFVRWLKNPVLRGHTPYLRKTLDGLKKTYEPQEIKYDTHPEEILITPGLDTKIYAILEGNAMIYSKKAIESGKPREHHPLVGLMRCAKCGRSMAIVTSGRAKNQHVYCISKRQKLPGTICGDLALNDTRTYHEKRGSTGIKLSEVESFVERRLATKAEELATDTVSLNESVELTKEQLKIVEEIRKLELMVKENGDSMGFKRLEIDHLKSQIKPKTKSIDPIQKNCLIDIYQNQAFWKQLNPEEKRYYLKALVSSVSIDGAKCVSVDFLF